jgi:phage gpG-like protein
MPSGPSRGALGYGGKGIAAGTLVGGSTGSVPITSRGMQFRGTGVHATITLNDIAGSRVAAALAELDGKAIKVGFQGDKAREVAMQRVSASSRVGRAAIHEAERNAGARGAKHGPKLPPRQGPKLPPRQGPKKPVFAGPKAAPHHGPKRAGGSKRKYSRGVLVRNKNGLTVATLATIHEFGSRKASIPARPFLRPAIRNNAGVIKTSMRRAVQTVLKGESAMPELARLAVRLEGLVRKTLVDLRTPPLAKATKRRRFKLTGDVDPNPLVDTGQLKNSITAVVVDDPRGR